METQYSSVASERPKAAAGPVLVTGLMALAYAANFMNQGIVLVVSEQIKVDFDLSNAQLGFVLGLSYMLFSALGAVPLGRIADLHSRSMVVGLSLTFMGIATALTSMVQSYWSMITLRAMAGTGDAGVLPGAVSMISDHVPVARRPLALSVFNAGASVGALFVYVCMGFVAQHYGWRTAYLWVGLVGALVGMVVNLALPDRKSGSAAHTGGGNWIGTTASVLRIVPYRQIVLAFVALGMTSSATWNWISPVVQRSYGFTVAEAGTLLGIGAGTATLLGSLFFGLVASRFRQRTSVGPLWLAVFMQLCVAGCFISALSSSGSWPMMLLIAAGYFFAGAGMVVVFSTVQEAVPAQSRGLAIGFAILLFSLVGQGLGPLITGIATDSLIAAHGNDALRVAMQYAMVVGTVWVCTHLMLVIRSWNHAKPL